MRPSLFAAAALLVLVACQNQSSYYEWGDYSSSVWRTTHAEGAVDVDAEIDSLNETVERSRANGRAVPPGMHAHIGMLYGLRGEMDTAIAAFESERELYPESTKLMERLIARAKGEPVEGVQ